MLGRAIRFLDTSFPSIGDDLSIWLGCQSLHQVYSYMNLLALEYLTCVLAHTPTLLSENFYRLEYLTLVLAYTTKSTLQELLSLGVSDLCVGSHTKSTYQELLEYLTWVLAYTTKYTLDTLVVYYYPTGFTSAFSTERAQVVSPAPKWVHNFLRAPTQVFWSSDVALPVFSHTFLAIVIRIKNRWRWPRMLYLKGHLNKQIKTSSIEEMDKAQSIWSSSY